MGRCRRGCVTVQKDARVIHAPQDSERTSYAQQDGNVHAKHIILLYLSYHYYYYHSYYYYCGIGEPPKRPRTGETDGREITELFEVRDAPRRRHRRRLGRPNLLRRFNTDRPAVCPRSQCTRESKYDACNSGSYLRGNPPGMKKMLGGPRHLPVPRRGKVARYGPTAAAC